MPSSGKKAFLWTTENSAMSGSRASQEHEQRPCVDMVDRSGHLYWMIRIPASQHLRRMGATATSVSCVESVSGVGPSHTLRMGSTPSSGYGTQQITTAFFTRIVKKALKAEIRENPTQAAACREELKLLSTPKSATEALKNIANKLLQFSKSIEKGQKQ